ncbi:hypothetical protein EPN87_00490 [archaeon]|nr:MAG: hypothetical protein EPN87_00490 [archaeon]
MEYVFTFDLPTEHASFRVKLHRTLKKINATQVQRSMWKSDNLRELTRLAVLVKNVGGSARITEERLIFQ